MQLLIGIGIAIGLIILMYLGVLWILKVSAKDPNHGMNGEK